MAAGAGGAGDVPAGHVLGGWGSGLNFNWEGVFGLNLPGYITIADLGIPLGLGGVPIFESWPSLPPLDAANAAETDLPPAIDRRDVTSNETELSSVAEVVGWGGPASEIGVGNVWLGPTKVWHARPGSLSTSEVQGLADAGYQVVYDNPTTPANIVETEDDVGWISDVYAGVDEVVFGGALPGGYIAPSVLGNLGGVAGAVFGAPTTAPTAPVVVQQGMPAIPQLGGPVAAACDNDPMKGYVLKKYCGEWRWIKSKNRRRKQLVTQTDLKGLAALKGVLGGGKAFEVWIATHS